MIAIIVIILAIFIVALSAVWIWYVKNETSQQVDFYALATKAFEHGDFAKAEELLVRLLQSEPNSYEGRYLLGTTYMELGNYEKAKECFDKALKSSPTDQKALFNMAKVLEQQESYQEAKEFYQKAAAENPDNAEYSYGIGVVEFKQGNFKDAVAVFEKAVELNPDDGTAVFYLAKSRAEMCDYSSLENAQQVIEEYLKIAKTPNLPKEFDVSLALAYAKTGQIDKTLAACQRALETDSENVETYKILGLAQLIKRDLASAKNTLTTGLHLDPSNEELHDILSYVLCQQKNRCALQECRDKYKDAIGKFLHKNTVNEV